MWYVLLGGWLVLVGIHLISHLHFLWGENDWPRSFFAWMTFVWDMLVWGPLLLIPGLGIFVIGPLWRRLFGLRV